VFAVWAYIQRRIPFILRGTLAGADDHAGPVRGLAAGGQQPSENQNLFEMPVLFYALVLYLFATNQVDGAYVAVAWVFVAFRALHSAVHCTVNVVKLRFFLYLISTLALAYMACRAALTHWAA
jgi:hypothetical protein